MIRRPRYMEVLRTYRDVPLVKILAGIRRCGKSTLLEMWRTELLTSGVAADHVLSERYTAESYYNGLTAREMVQRIRAKMTDDSRYYLLLDEVQEVEDWERAVNSLLESANVDIYVTGSNSRLMAGEISTYLSGRYVSIPVFPLSFSEYLDFKSQSNRSTQELFSDYLHYGGFPIVALGDFDERAAYQIVDGIYNSVITNDIARRHQITNLDLFNRVVRFVVENVGKTFSANSIVKFLRGEGRSLSVELVYNYLEWLEKAFIIYRCRRYDLQGKSVLKTQEKFYLADAALKYCVMGFNPKLIASMLENIVYFELLRRGYQVYIGKLGTKEIDFVAERQGARIYVQVCRTLPEDSDREIANLLEIRDQHPKLIVTLDPYAAGNVDGVRILHAVDFLLSAGY